MAALRFNDREQAALLGLPHAAIALYLWLRARMDFATGFVGVRPLVSWFALAQDLYVEPHRGPLHGRSRSGRPSIDQVYRLSGVLERAGLVSRRSKIEPPQLIFKLPLADTLSLVQKKPAPNPRGQPAGARSEHVRGESIDRPTKPARGRSAKPAPHQVSGSKRRLAAGNGSSIESAAAAELTVFPPKSSPGERRAFMAIASRHQLSQGELQLLLDELAERWRRSDVRNAGALLASMAEQLREGSFHGVLADRWRGGGAPLSIAELAELEKLVKGRGNA